MHDHDIIRITQNARIILCFILHCGLLIAHIRVSRAMGMIQAPHSHPKVLHKCYPTGFQSMTGSDSKIPPHWHPLCIHNSCTIRSIPQWGSLQSKTQIKIKFKSGSSNWTWPPFKHAGTSKHRNCIFMRNMWFFGHSSWCALACILPNRIISPGERPVDY